MARLTVDRRAGVRGALLHTLPGRVIVVGIALKLAVLAASVLLGAESPFLSVVDRVAGLAAAVGVSYFLVQLILLAKRRLLWRVRRKLLVSYIFIGFFPAFFLAAFSLLCGFLLFLNFSSYLVQARLQSLSDRAEFVAQNAALEIQRAGGRDVAGIISHRQAIASDKSAADVSIAVLPVAGCSRKSEVGSQKSEVGSQKSEGRSQPSAVSQTSDFRLPTFARAGLWSHGEPPRAVPAWIGCSGYSGVFAYSHKKMSAGDDADTHLLVRSVAFPDTPRPGYAVVVDLVVNDRVRQELRRDTGVDVRSVTAADSPGPEFAKPLPGAAGGHDGQPAVVAESGVMGNLPGTIEFRDWLTGTTGSLTIRMSLSVAELYDRISSAGGNVGRRVGQGLLLALFAIGALFLIIQFMALIAGLALAKSITGSVHQLFAGTERVRQGDFIHKIAVKTDDQLGELSVSFNSMTASIEDLLVQAAEKKRLEEELRIAHEIQMSLLPQGPLYMPGLSVTALCVPAREVGGDYYDFLPLDDHRVGVLIADVSGKGTSAALYMAELKGLMLSLSEIHSSPRELLIAANRIIAHHLDARSFITMTYAVVDLRKRIMTYARAGHTPLIYVPGAGIGARDVRILTPDGMVVGLKLDNGEMFARLLQEETIALRPGDLYLFFTDGISEAMNAHDDCFGESRLGELVQAHAHLPSAELRERVLREIAAFVGDAPQHDDMTMILLKVDEVGEAVA
jgi:sigma-B regulation protein RsbU (phosphoserine phosphatase)